MAFTREELLTIADNATQLGDMKSATEAMHMLDDLDAQTDRQTVKDFWGQGTGSRVGTTINDLAATALSGMTGGYGDTLTAAADTAVGNIGSSIKLFGKPLMEDPDYETELAKQETEERARRARLNAANPGSATAFETLTGLAGAGKFAKLASFNKTGKFARGFGNVAGGAGWGGLSAAGHGEDPLQGALWGGAGGALIPGVAALAGPLTRGAITGGMAAAGGAVAGGGGGYLGGKMGDAIGKGGSSVWNMATSPEFRRNLLAQIARLPGAGYGPMTGQ